MGKEHKLPAMKPVVLISALLLALTIGASFWVYFQGAQAMREQAKAQGLSIYIEGAAGAQGANDADQRVPRLLRQVDDWALKVTLSTAAGGAGLMFVTVLAFLWWRKACFTKMVETTKELTKDSNKLQGVVDDLQRATSDKKRLEEELRQTQAEINRRVEERTSTLAKTYAQLEAELNERKQAEKALAQQAQELERSKDVLELHVQARTQELQKLQRRYEQVLNSAGEGIYGLDLQGKATFVNPAAAKLTGWKVEEMIGKLEADIFYRTATNTPQNATSFAKKDGEHLSEQIFSRKDGTTFTVEYIRTPIMEKGKMLGAVVIFKDITERKRTEDALARKAAELARSNAELEQFAYVASHDLQEPLRKIQAFGDRLKAKCDAVQLQEGRDYLERMQSAAARMQTLINDLLTFSRVISTTQPFVPVDLGQVTREVLTDLEVRIEQSKAKVEIGELPTIEADPLQMRQLLQNLIGNALKFQASNAQPVVAITAQIVKKPFGTGGETEPSDEICELIIKDNGIGFEEKYSEKIFAVFQRLHGRTEYEGTGVGLAVCRRITDRHGGSINAKSNLGEGATFIISLPVKHSQAQGQGQAAAQQPQAPAESAK